MAHHLSHQAIIGFALMAAIALTGCGSSGNSSTQSSKGACTPVGASLASATLSANILPSALSAMNDAGPVEPTQTVPVTLSLNLNHVDELDQLVNEVYRPGSIQFHQFITPAEFRARFAPTVSQTENVTRYLTEQGFTDVHVNDNGYFVHASAQASTINSAFKTELRKYQAADGETYFAPKDEPVIPPELEVRAVHGLHNLTHMRSYAHLAPDSTSAPLVGPLIGLTASKIRAAYNIPVQLSASGQTIALVEFDGYTPSDIAAYVNYNGLTPVPLTNVLVDGATGAPSNSTGPGEVTIDIELALAVAAHANRVLVYEAPNNTTSILDVYSRIANDNLASVVSTSWGTAEANDNALFLEAESTLFKQMAVQGQTVFAAAGDRGAFDNGGNTLSVDDPGSQPFVTCVGGTSLITRNGQYASESTWQTDSEHASGGGVSAVWTQPSWQTGLANSLNLQSTTLRNVPDVSLNADPAHGYAIFFNGAWVNYGGTSTATPLWAAFAALVNNGRLANGQGVLGFLNPYLYNIGRGERYRLDFHDVSDRSTNLYYPSVPGYDSATGWGSFNGANLYQDLIQAPTSPLSNLSC